jgi:signal transduction histidine kinase
MHERYAQMKRFASARFAKVWDNPAERRELARGLSESFGVDLVIKNQSGQVVERLGSSCRHLLFSIQVTRDGEELGSVETCPPQGHRRKLTSFLLALAAAVLTLWMGSGAIARKLARPLAELASVTHDLGQGKLKRRARLRQHDPGELGELASSINEMAERIAKQLDDQRELLAAVSHEIRTPLARLRVLIDLLADAGCDQELTGQLEREVLEIDHLTEDLLASSRLEFQAVNHTALDPNMLAARALERCNLPEGLLQPESAQATIHGDATLLGRALTNLLINAECHGGGVDRLIVAQGDGRLTFTVTDRGPGFTPSALQHAFDRFFRDENPRRKAGSALGLGLALVRRIARAHAGEAFADNREGGGAQVGFWVCSQQQ